MLLLSREPGEHAKPDLAPTLLLGVGAVGERVATRVHERLQAETGALTSGFVLCAMRHDAADIAEVVRGSVLELTRQRTVSALESVGAIRQPARRYLRLNLVCAAALAEVEAETLIACLESFFAVQHPAAGMEVVFLLDATHPGNPYAVAPNAQAQLEALEAAWRKRDVEARRIWAAAPRVRFLVVHPHRADGSHLDHACLASPEGNQNDSTVAADEFEALLSAVLVGHIAPGALHDRLAPQAPEDPETHPFALLGWARDRFPREAILHRVSDLLAADLLEYTAQSEPGKEAAETLLGNAAGGTPGPWEAWQRQMQAALLDRRSLLVRLLTPGTHDGAIQIRDDRPPPPRRTLYQRLRGHYFGEEAPDNTGRLAVRLSLPAHAWRGSDPRQWPAEIKARETEAKAKTREVLERLNAQTLPQQVAEEVRLALARCLDLCIRRYPGGTDAARQLIADTVQIAEQRVAQEQSPPFGPPSPPEDLGLPSGAGLKEAQAAFETQCAALPGWQAATARGIAFGALATTACLSLGWPLWIGWLLAAGSLGTALSLYSAALGRLLRLGDYVLECLRAEQGLVLYNYAQQAAGNRKNEGVYQAISRLLTEQTLPQVEAFARAREAAITSARQPVTFALSDGSEEPMGDADDARELHALLHSAFATNVLREDARRLLQSSDLFQGWRQPQMNAMTAQVSDHARRTFLRDWERPNKTLGTFVRSLLARHIALDKVEALFQQWVRERMDRLAMRAVPLALRVPLHPERATENEDMPLSLTLSVAVPPSLEWHRAVSPDAATENAETLPAGTAAADLAAWFGVAGAACQVVNQETDESAVLMVAAGLTPAEVVKAFGEAQEASLPVAFTSRTERGDVVTSDASTVRSDMLPFPVAFPTTNGNGSAALHGKRNGQASESPANGTAHHADDALVLPRLPSQEQEMS